MADESLIIKLIADARGLIDGVQDGSHALEHMGDLVEKGFKAVSVVAFGAAVYKTATAVMDLTKEVGAQAERIGQLAEVTGLSEQRVQEWGSTFKAAGGSVEDLVQGTRTLSQQMIAAAEGGAEARATFARLGVDATQIGSDTEMAFTAVIDQLAKMPPGFERTAVATQLLGRGAANLLPVFAQGSEKFKQMAEEARAFGAVLSGPQLDALKASDDAFDRLNLATEGFGKQVAAAFAPAVKWVTDLSTAAIALTTQVFMGMVEAATILTARFTGFARAAVEIASAIVSVNIFSKEHWQQAIQNVQAIDAETAATIAAIRAQDNLAPALQKTTQGLASQEAIGKQIVERTSQMAATWQLAKDIQEKLGAAVVKRGTEMYQNAELVKKVQEDLGKQIVANTTASYQADQIGVQIHQRELADNAKLADAAFNLAKAKYDAESGFYRDTESLRQAKLAAINADEQAQLAQTQLTETQKTTIMMNAEAQRIQVAQQFPTFWEQQLQTIQQSAAFVWGNIVTSFSGAIAQMIVMGGTLQQFMQQVAVSILQAVLNTLIQMGVEWALHAAKETAVQAGLLAVHTTTESAKTTVTGVQEGARLGIAFATNKAIMAGVIVTLGGIAAVGTAAMGVMAAVVAATAGVLAAIGGALLASIVGAPLAPAYFLAAAAVAGIGGTAVAGGLAVIETSIGAAIAAATTALATPFASGGIVTGPTFGLIGEAGPEAVVPLSEMGSMGGSFQQSIQVVLDDRVLLDVMVDKLIPMLRLRGLEV